MKLNGVRGLLKSIKTEDEKLSQKTSNETNDNRGVSGKKSIPSSSSKSNQTSSSSSSSSSPKSSSSSKKSEPLEDFVIISSPSGLKTQRMKSSSPNPSNPPSPVLKKAPRAPRKQTAEGIASVAAPTKRKRRTKAEMEAYRAELAKLPPKEKKIRVVGGKAKANKLKDKTIKDSVKDIPPILFDKALIAARFEHGDKVSIPSPTFDNPESRFKHRTTVVFDRVENNVVWVLYDMGNDTKSVPLKFGIYDYQ